MNFQGILPIMKIEETPSPQKKKEKFVDLQ